MGLSACSSPTASPWSSCSASWCWSRTHTRSLSSLCPPTSPAGSSSSYRCSSPSSPCPCSRPEAHILSPNICSPVGCCRGLLYKCSRVFIAYLSCCGSSGCTWTEFHPSRAGRRRFLRKMPIGWTGRVYDSLCTRYGSFCSLFSPFWQLSWRECTWCRDRFRSELSEGLKQDNL